MFRIFIFLVGVTYLKAQDVIVTIDSGLLRGTTAVTQNGTTYYKFVGVPYAEPPIGDLRFRAPQPPANWSGVRDALQETTSCSAGGGGVEDCLYLNVFVPLNATNVTTPLATILHTYGGGFSGGEDYTSEYGPDFLLEKGVIVVDYNYRSGPIGFLSLQNDDIPGNAGMKDFVAVLQWVQRNIAVFGGDPSLVTISGHSSGACMVAHAFISPLTAGLFSAAIIQSGQATSPWGIEPNPREKAYRLAAAMGFDGDDDTALAEFLRSVDHTELTADNNRALSDWELRRPSQLPFAPTIEPESETAVIVEDPYTVLLEGRFNQVPLMTGVASADGSIEAPGIIGNPSWAADLNANFTDLVGSQLLLPTEGEQVEAAIQIENFYFGEQGLNIEDTQAVYDFCSDMYWIESTEKLVRVVANLSSSPVYYYYFDYNGTECFDYGCTHGAELYYIFIRGSVMPNQDPESLDGQVKDRVTTLWTNFVKYRDPAPGGSPMLWEPYTTQAHNYLDMKAEFVQLQDPIQERMEFWWETVPI